MTIRDVQCDFSYTSSSSSFPIFGAAGTYIFPNTYDTSPLAAYLTEFSSNDTQLSGNVNTFRDMGGGDPLWLVVDWTQAVNTLTSVRTELITSAASSLSAPVVMIDFRVWRWPPSSPASGRSCACRAQPRGSSTSASSASRRVRRHHGCRGCMARRGCGCHRPGLRVRLFDQVRN